MDHLIAPSSMIEVARDLNPLSSEKGDAHSSSKRELRPPRYTICGFRKETITGMRRNGRDAPIPDLPRHEQSGRPGRLRVWSKIFIRGDNLLSVVFFYFRPLTILKLTYSLHIFRTLW